MILNAWFSNPNLTKLTDEQYEEMMDAYRRTYYDDDSIRVLTTELTNLCFFRESLTEEDRIRSNHAKELLCRLGVWRPENAEKIVRKLLEVRIENA